ncbi:MAG: hypothetical protein V4812_16080 [Pseudomonadota bacterium]
MAQASDDGLTPTLYPLDLPGITDLVIVQASVQVAQNEEDCSAFEMTEKDVRRYFAQAQRIEQQDYSHMVDWSSCQATGTVAFADGSRANWRLQRYRAGLLVYPDGREQHLYCAQCAEPFQ